MHIDKTYPLSELTGKIIGCAMEVHRHLGNGFPEFIYQRALAIEMDLQDLNYQREYEMEVVYKNFLIGKRRADFFVENEIMVELKAVIELENLHLAQAINYLEASKKNVGLLINFGNTSLQFKRVMKPKQSKKIHSQSAKQCNDANHNHP